MSGMKVLALGLLMGACSAKLDTQTTGGAANASTAGDTSSSATSPSGSKGQAAADPLGLVGQWDSECLARPSDSQVPGTVASYEFLTDGTGRFRTISYRDSLCEQRYTKADVDKLKVKLRAEAQASGGDLSEEELQAYDRLWQPPTLALVYKFGRRYGNGLTELDLGWSQVSGEKQDRYLSFYIDKGQLYFAEVCTQLEAQLASCGPVAGDRPENRAQSINFNIAFEHKPLVKVPETP